MGASRLGWRAISGFAMGGAIAATVAGACAGDDDKNTGGGFDAAGLDVTQADRAAGDASGGSDVATADVAPPQDSAIAEAAADAAPDVDSGVDAAEASVFDGGIGVDFDGGSCVLTTPPCADASNVFANPGFETVPGAQTGQGYLPSDWVEVTASPDTFSNDSSYGLAPAGFGNFTGVVAHAGLRWVAGWSNVPERFGQNVGTLQAGHTYRLAAFLHTAIRADLSSPGSYRVYFANGVSQTTTAPAGTFCPIVAQAWEARSFDFTVSVDAGALPLMVFEPYAVASGGAYPGIDDVSLTDVTGCAR